jgi:hypothetical protein
MAKGFRELLGVAPSAASTKDSVLIIIDAQNEYVIHKHDDDDDEQPLK